MKTPTFEPRFALWLGFLIAPLACALNAAVLAPIFSQMTLKTGEWQVIGLVASFVTGPQGAVTYLILQWGQSGKTREARTLSAVCALLSVGFWLWLWHGLELNLHWGYASNTPLFAALLLPFLWSLGFGVFALLARHRE